MTPYSAATGGSFSSRESSRSAAFVRVLGQAGRLDPLAQLVDLGLLLVALAQLLLDRLELLAEEVLALALVDLRLDLRLDLGAELDDLELAGEDLGEPAQPAGDVDRLEQLLLLLGRDAQGAGDQVREGGGVVEVGDGELELLGQIGDRLDDLGEGALDVAGQRLELGGGLEHVRHRLDPRHQVGLLADVVGDPDPLGALDQDAQRAVGHLHHPGDGPGDADAVEVVGAGRVVLGVPRRDHRQHPVAGEDVVDEVDRALLADRERRQRVGVGDRLPQREDRQGVRERLGAAGGVLDVGDLHHLQLGSLDVGHCQCAFPAAAARYSGPLDRNLARRPRHAGRQLHPEDPVLVGGLSLLGVDVDGELDHAPEGAGGKLDLLVGPALGVADRALAADHERPPRHLEVDRVQLDPRQLDLDDRLLRGVLAAVVDVDAGHERRDLAALAVAGLVPEVAEQLVHLPAHPGEVREWIALAGHCVTG